MRQYSLINASRVANSFRRRSATVFLQGAHVSRGAFRGSNHLRSFKWVLMLFFVVRGVFKRKIDLFVHVSPLLRQVITFLIPLNRSMEKIDNFLMFEFAVTIVPVTMPVQPEYRLLSGDDDLLGWNGHQFSSRMRIQGETVLRWSRIVGANPKRSRFHQCMPNGSAFWTSSQLDTTGNHLIYLSIKCPE